MTSQPLHARTFDIPGWRCPPRVRDISSHQGSWGLVRMSPMSGAVAQDELGHLWADGDVIPQFSAFNTSIVNPGAILLWTSEGLGVCVHPRSLAYLRSVSRLDMQDDQWVPIAVVVSEPPMLAQESSKEVD